MKKSLLLLAFCILALSSCGTYKSTLPPDGGEAVNVGYGSVPKDNLTASVSKVKPKATDSSYSDIFEYLRGRVPGLVVRPDNSMIIRGQGSISSETDPLIMVDGVEVKDISYLDPSMIESVEVIKDGTSAIYGVRGANGVILITTKR